MYCFRFRQSNGWMSIGNLIELVEIDPAECDKLYAFCHVFRSLAPPDVHTFDIGLVLATSVPVICKAPIDDADADEPIGLFDPENIRIFAPHSQKFIEIEDRLLSLNESPAQFTLEDLVIGEMIGHKTRQLACFQQNSVKRGKLFFKAVNIYERLIMVCDNDQAQIQYLQTTRAPQSDSQGYIFPKYGKNRPGEEGSTQQCISRIFAGMAVCELMGARSIKTYCSYASASIHWASGRALELACCLRIFPYFIAMRLIVLKANTSDIQNMMEMTYQVSKNVLLPLMLELGRRDMFDQEIRLFGENCREVCEREAANQNKPYESTGDELQLSLVRGQFIQRKCAKCGTEDQTIHFKRCSKCHRVFYCGKECQIEHWKEHKAVCRRSET